MAAQLLAQWGPTIVKNLPTILLAADGMYKIYRTVSDSNEEKKTVQEAMKLIEEKQGDIDRLMEDNKKMKAVLEGLTLLMDRLNQHYENQASHPFPPSNTMAPPCCHNHHHPWGPPGCHHHDTRGQHGCQHHYTRAPSGCHHHDTRGQHGCQHHYTRTPSGCHHHDTRGQHGCQHHPPGCHYEDPQSPSGIPSSAQELSDDDDEDCGATSSDPSSRGSSWRECSVCRRNYNMTNRRPTILGCGHTFCRKCLGEVAQRGPLHCPTCRTLEKRPSSLLPSNVVLMVALEEEGQRRETGTQNNDDVDDWKKKSTVLQESEELLMQMVLQISTEAEAKKDEDDWKKTNALLQEEEESQIQMALQLSMKTEAEANKDEDDWKTSSLLQEEEELNIQMALQLSLQDEVNCSALLNSQHDPEDNGILQTVIKIKDSCIKLEKHITDDVLPKVGRISLGLMEAQECRRELMRFRKELTSASERLMCHLKQLDTIDFQSTDSQGRQMRKYQVKKILNLMDQFDKMQENINQLMLNYT